jgi:seryl-tRNA synthetase
METQEQLDKWINSCLNYYNKKTNTKMKTNEERFHQLEQAHSRLYNQFNTLHQDYLDYRSVMVEEVAALKELIKSLQPKEDDVPELPDEMKNGIEYKAVIYEVLKSKDVKWQNMDYTNWEVRLVGKEEYVCVAFIPTGNPINPGNKVRFTYAQPFQLKKLKVI